MNVVITALQGLSSAPHVALSRPTFAAPPSSSIRSLLRHGSIQIKLCIFLSLYQYSFKYSCNATYLKDATALFYESKSRICSSEFFYVVVHFIETRLQHTIGIKMKMQMACLQVGW